MVICGRCYSGKPAVVFNGISHCPECGYCRRMITSEKKALRLYDNLRGTHEYAKLVVFKNREYNEHDIRF